MNNCNKTKIKAAVYMRFANEPMNDLISKNGQKVKAALYCRVVGGHLNDDSVYVQMDKLRRFAEDNNFEIVSEYLDVAYNGMNFDNRTGFKRLNADLDAGAINTVIVRSVDRISRDILLAESWISKIKKQGVDLLALDASLKLMQ